MPEKLLNKETGKVLEIEYSSRLKHKNVVSFIEDGSVTAEEGVCPYYITNYFTGELLSEKIAREEKLDEETALSIYRQILDGLDYIHSLSLMHNDITPRNILLSASTNGTPELIDLGHVSTVCNGKVPFDTSDLELFYCANETFAAGIYDEQSDLFAATAVLYTMLTGKAPWTREFSDQMSRSRKTALLMEHRKSNPLDVDSLPISDKTKAILLKGLAVSYNDRFKKVAHILKALDSEEVTEVPKKNADAPVESRQATPNKNDSKQEDNNPNRVEFEIKRGSGNGFKDIAGMEELKNYLYQRVIFVIKNKEKVEKYRLSTPNGLLLYGPPGCGKTFVAEKFADGWTTMSERT